MKYLIQGLCLADCIRLYDFIWLLGYISNAKVSFSPISEENSQFQVEKKSKKNCDFIMVKVGLKLFVQHVEYSTLHNLIYYITKW